MPNRSLEAQSAIHVPVASLPVLVSADVGMRMYQSFMLKFNVKSQKFNADLVSALLPLSWQPHLHPVPHWDYLYSCQQHLLRMLCRVSRELRAPCSHLSIPQIGCQPGYCFPSASCLSFYLSLPPGTFF